MGVFLPLELALLALAGPIIIFYMLRLRREELSVSSSMLWRRALMDRTANAPWQRLRRNLLLLLQLLLLLLLALAVAQASSDKGALHAAIKGLSASNGRGNMAQAVTLAGASARAMGDATVVLLSDGASAGTDALPIVPAKSRYVNFGQSASNIA